MVEVAEVDSEAPSRSVIERAARIIKEGGLVIYPTETVYGLAADARSDEGVARVFEAKSRPLENPISVAVSSLEMAGEAGEISSRAGRLFREFMPGPLSIIVKARSSLSKLLSAGTGKIGIRFPDHLAAQKLIEEFGEPITSTSANISGRPAPFTAQDALDQLGDHVDFAIDSGSVRICRPSTVVDATGEELEIVREGPISVEKLKAALDRPRE
ncbi:hypothetical protein AKJ58_00450 [candidate division MSBL1 archaeon SCGC-AAA385D11]|uniref:L-threonylcarbamoyladenylate synthase n=1 Tax=candidate division MSBL1 archaeon SCGC-AAA385D11 TaxID=1698286 RepID=A0A133VPC5_9EURY|nr:hypothetical protein AKJ58_00450 [candidate division MSBL1 archaeon SCGC-AAA385D11]